MIKVNYTEKKERGIEVGDIFVAGCSVYLQFVEIGDKFGLMDVEESRMVRHDLNHATHAINFIKREYGEFTVIQKERITIDIE